MTLPPGVLLSKVFHVPCMVCLGQDFWQPARWQVLVPSEGDPLFNPPIPSFLRGQQSHLHHLRLAVNQQEYYHVIFHPAEPSILRQRSPTPDEDMDDEDSDVARTPSDYEEDDDDNMVAPARTLQLPGTPGPGVSFPSFNGEAVIFHVRSGVFLEEKSSQDIIDMMEAIDAFHMRIDLAVVGLGGGLALFLYYIAACISVV
ncbi:hypothetical protein K474DRAFT_1679325 [Panus rudis PR-1116 ss-1]|nr:hypothetical protein K474DRAFT_1679325 [Panus rudis PR-1116 ss-1]